ncbi:flocculation protein FLO11-like isoform X2 [Gopherus evgoodei]|uniref:flocculation protein FLO11-like isoform X2 n=1 Tax=Gopherus evgoodei TaxID=1825980 RepID=UPI0011CEFF18|nr:flocculation protein FLO11-like isoform X2 [Gopherus evgoodei]
MSDPCPGSSLIFVLSESRSPPHPPARGGPLWAWDTGLGASGGLIAGGDGRRTWAFILLSESQRSRKSLLHQEVSAGRPVPEDTVEKGVSAGRPVPEDRPEEGVSARRHVPKDTAEEEVSAGSPVPKDTAEEEVSAGSPVPEDTAEEGVSAGSPVPEDTAEEEVSAGSPVPEDTAEEGVSAGSPVPEDTAEEEVSAGSPVPEDTAEEGVSAGSPVPEDTAEEGVSARRPVPEDTPEEGVSAGSPVPEDTAEEGVSAGSPVPEDTAEEGVSAGSPVPEDTAEEEVSAGSPVPEDTAEEGVSAGSPVPEDTAEEEVSAGSPVPEDTAEEEVSAGSPVPEDTAEEEVSALAGPRDPNQHPSAVITISSPSSTHGVEPMASNRLCPQRPCEPPGAGMKRKSSARVREAEGEGEEKSLFYMKVQAVNGVSVAWETGAGFEAIRKRPRIFKAKYSGGESFAGSDLSSSHTKSELGDVDQEAESGAGGPAEEVPQQPTGVPPEWLLTIEQGVRCLACCRVFPSLEALTQHVKQGLREGFSCRVYYRVLGQMRARERSQRRRQRGGQGFQPRVRECSKCGGQIRRPHKAAK